MADTQKPEEQDERDLLDPVLPQAAAEAVLEIVSETEVPIERAEAIEIAEELLEKFTSPLMIQRAAGATSSVSITASPAEGIESARSVKGRNILLNLRDAAFALPSTLPALMALYEKYGKSDSTGQIALLAIVALFGLLKTLSTVLQVPLTKRTAGVLHAMWGAKEESEESVPHDGLLEIVNLQFEKYGWQQIDAGELLIHLETLERIDCIEKDDAYDSILVEKIRWRLKERVKITY